MLRQCHPSVRAATPLTLACRPLPSTQPALVHSDYQRLHSAQGWQAGRHSPASTLLHQARCSGTVTPLSSPLFCMDARLYVWLLSPPLTHSPSLSHSLSFLHTFTHSPFSPFWHRPSLLSPDGVCSEGGKGARCTSDHHLYTTDQFEGMTADHFYPPCSRSHASPGHLHHLTHLSPPS